MAVMSCPHCHGNFLAAERAAIAARLRALPVHILLHSGEPGEMLVAPGVVTVKDVRALADELEREK